MLLELELVHLAAKTELFSKAVLFTWNEDCVFLSLDIVRSCLHVPLGVYWVESHGSSLDRQSAARDDRLNYSRSNYDKT